jgi:hypothetical protein
MIYIGQWLQMCRFGIPATSRLQQWWCVLRKDGSFAAVIYHQTHGSLLTMPRLVNQCRQNMSQPSGRIYRTYPMEQHPPNIHHPYVESATILVSFQMRSITFTSVPPVLNVSIDVQPTSRYIPHSYGPRRSIPPMMSVYRVSGGNSSDSSWELYREVVRSTNRNRTIGPLECNEHIAPWTDPIYIYLEFGGARTQSGNISND